MRGRGLRIRSVRRKKRRSVKSWGQKIPSSAVAGPSPSCLESLCLWRPVQPTPSKEPSTPPFSALCPPVRSCCGGCYRLAPWPGCSGKRRTAPGTRAWPSAARTRVLSSSWLEPAEQEAGARQPLWAAARRRRLFRYRHGRAGREGAAGLPGRSAGARASAVRPTRTPHGLLKA